MPVVFSDNVLVLEWTENRLYATRVLSSVHQVSAVSFSADEITDAAFAGRLKTFLRPMQGRCKMVVLFPQSRCRMRVFRFPAARPSELVDMTALQFVRATPNRRDEVLVAARVLERFSHKQLLVSGVMTTQESMTPVLLLLERLAFLPEAIVPAGMRLVPLARRVWGKDLNTRKGFVILLRLDQSIILGFIVRGDLVFCREEPDGANVAVSLEMFIDFCRMEYADIPVTEAASIDALDAATGSRRIHDVPVAVFTLGALTRSADEAKTLAVSPRAFLDDIFAHDPVIRGVMDLSPVAIQEARGNFLRQSLTRHGLVLGLLLFLGIVLVAGADIQRLWLWNQDLQRDVAHNAVQVRGLEDQAQTLTALAAYARHKVNMTALMAAIVAEFPSDIRLTELRFSENKLVLNGESPFLEPLQAFVAALGRRALLKNVLLERIDKRPAEQGELVLFSISGEVSP